MAIHTTPDSYTKLLIHSDTSDGITTFVDSSANGHTITGQNGVHHETDQKKFGATSIEFASSNDYIEIPYNANICEFTGDFTWDWWLYLTSHQSVGILSNHAGGTTNGWLIHHMDTGRPTFYFQTEAGGTWDTKATTKVLDLNVWMHCAVVRSGTQLLWFVDGVLIDEFDFYTGSIHPNSSRPFWINWDASPTWTGYMDEIRISNGIARWTDSFVPPNKPYSVVGDDFVTDVAGIEDVGDGITKLSSDIIIKSDPDEASTDSVFSVSAKDGTVLLDVLANGRSLSQFTAKAWAYFDGTGTPSFHDSYNCSTITDHTVGTYSINFTNNLGSADYAAVASAGYTQDGPYGPAKKDAVTNLDGDSTAALCKMLVNRQDGGSSSIVDDDNISLIVFGD